MVYYGIIVIGLLWNPTEYSLWSFNTARVAHLEFIYLLKVVMLHSYVKLPQADSLDIGLYHVFEPFLTTISLAFVVDLFPLNWGRVSPSLGFCCVCFAEKKVSREPLKTGLV